MLYQTSALLNRSPITLVWFERKQWKEYVKNDTENSHTLKIKLLCLTFEYSCDWIQIAVKRKLHNYFYDWTLLTFSNTQVLVLISNQFTLYAFVIANAFKMLSSLTQSYEALFKSVWHDKSIQCESTRIRPNTWVLWSVSMQCELLHIA